MDESGVHEQASEVLRDLRELVGGPGYETLAKRHGALSKSNVGNLLKGTTSPRDATVMAFIEACLGYGGRRLPAEHRDRSFWWQRYRQALRSAPQRVDITVADYLDVVRRQFGPLQLDALIPLNDQDEHPPVRLREVFIGQDVRANPPRAELPRDVWLRLIDSGHVSSADLPAGFDRDLLTRLRQDYQQRPRRSVLAVLAHPSAMRTVLLGDPGAGKSTLARYLALALADAVPPPPELEPLRGLVPLVVELRIFASYASGGGDFLDLIDHTHATEGFGLPRATTESLLTRGRTLVVFDGLDEVFDPGERTTISKRIGAFAAKYPRAKVVVTSRVVGYQRAVLDTAGFAHHKLEDLTTEQVGAFVRRWFDTALPDDPAESARLRRRLMAAMAESKAVSELAGNPLLLTILAIIGRRRELPRDRRAVHQHAVTVLVQHWDPNKYLLASRFAEGMPTIVEEDKLELLRRVARRMQAAPKGLAGNHIPGADLVEEFEQYLHDDLELPMHQARPGAEQMLEQFRHRNFILSRFGAGVYGFVHRAFLEYLAAEDLVRRFAERKLDESDLLELFAARWSDPAWHEVLRHITGMLSQDFARLVVEHLLELNPDWRRQKHALPHHIVLALQCLSEVRRLGPLADTSCAVMRALTETLLVASLRQRNYDSDLTLLLENSVPSVLASFGPYWAGREVYRAWFAEHHRSLALQANYSNARALVLATRIAVLLSNDDADLSEVLMEQTKSSSMPAVRVAAISGLTSGEDEVPQVSALLRALATGDQTAEVRSAALAGLKRWLGPADANWVRSMVSEEAGVDIVDTAVSVVAEKWADDENTLPWLQDLLERGVAQRPVAEVLASRWSPDSDVLAWLQALVEGSPSTRTDAIKAVGAGWAHVPGVREWLVGLAEKSTNEARAAAITAVGSAWRGDHDVVRWLRGRVPLEPDHDARHAAVHALGESELAPGSEADLRRWARSDPSWLVRQTATEALAKHTMSPELCDWLRTSLATEPDGSVRTILVHLLSQADVPGDWARSVAATDPDSSVRREAVQAVIGQSTEPDLLEWLLAFVRTEPSSYVRTAVVQMIVEAWPERQETLNWLRTGSDGGLDEAIAIDGLAVRWLHEPWFTERLRAIVAPGNPYAARSNAIRYLGVHWGEEARELLLRMVEWDILPSIRSDAFDELAKRMGDSPEELEWMRTRLVEDHSDAVRLAAFTAIVERGRRSPAARAWVEATIASGSLGEIHELLVFRLSFRAHGQESLRAVLMQMAEGDASDGAREEALPYAIRDVDLATSSAWLRERFDRETSPRLRQSVLRALGRRARDAGLVGWLRNVAVSDEPETVRVEALVHSVDGPADLQVVYPTTSDKVAQQALLNKIVDRWYFDDGIQEWFIDMAESAPQPGGRATALAAHARHWETRPGLLEWLWQRLDDTSPLVRCAVIEAISSSWTHLPGVTARLRAVDDLDLTVRLALLENCRYWGPESATVEWARDHAQDDPDPTVRAEALQTVAGMMQGGPEIVEWLVKRAAEDDDWEPRSQAILLATYLGGHQSQVLTSVRDFALHDDDPMVRSAAVESWALGWSVHPDERTALARVGVEDARSDVRLATVRALGATRPGDPEISAWLQERLQDSDVSVAHAAARELSRRLPVPRIPEV
ncbi:HEAT repeat domain-containing protein [Micromonospora sp. STR1s_5]|nr:HEAT repeat domain-containing protein [Micromonospora sp. STR1s_5]